MKLYRTTKYRFQWGERQSMISAEFWANYWGVYYFGDPKCNDYIVASEKKYLDTYASITMLKEMHAFSGKFFKKEYRRKFLEDSKRYQRKYWNFYRRFEKIQMSKLSDVRLAALLTDYVQLVEYFSALFVASDDKGLYAVTKRVEAILYKKKMSHVFPIVTTPSQPDLFIEEQQDLQKLARRRKSTKKQLLEHARKHAWLFFNSYNESENIQYIKNRLHEPLDVNKKIRTLKKLKERQRVIFNGMRNAELHDLCIFMQKMGIDRLHLKNCWAGAEFRFLGLFQEISKRIGVNFLEMMASYRFENYQTALLQGDRLSLSAVKRRQIKFVLWKKGTKLIFSDNQKEVSAVLNSLRKGVVKKNSKKVEGMPANPGIVSGMCRLVRSVDIHQVLEDMKKFKKGEILVTWMTQPNMVPIASKAAAIIADEGGMMSHAAVIAREFGIPCIVGAHNATKVLKTGDRVEVDATKGVIKKI